MSKISVFNKDVDSALATQLNPVVYLPKINCPNTTVVKRAQCTDFSQDLLPRFGISRVMTQQIMEVQGESGPNGEMVFKPINDQMDQVRFVGDWASSIGAAGNQLSSSGTDYFEVTFYGTGLNLLVRNNTSATAAVDGGAAGANFMPASFSFVLDSRNYSMNAVVNAVSGLTLGLHTVKLTSSAFRLFGYEVLNTNSTLQQTPGTSYLGGKRLYAPALTTSSPTSGFTNVYGTAGSKGGHVLVYQKSDGTIAKDIRYTEVTQGNLTAASHTNEEVIRTISIREFGAGRSDDFSLIGNSNINAAFTLDDGTTTLVANNSRMNTSNGIDSLSLFASGALLTLTFVGTGLDIDINEPGTLDSCTHLIDGVTSNAYVSTGLGTSTYTRVKVVSGLPYGTHTYRFTRNAFVNNVPQFRSFTIYGPSKPALPAGCVELADYYDMADYSPNITYGSAAVVSPGVLRKMLIREAVYSGTWAIQAFDTGFAGGFNIRSNTSASYVELTFVGTGIEYRPLLGNVAYNYTFLIDGAAATGSTFTYTGSGLTYNASTGLLSGTAAGTNPNGYAGGLWSVNNLTFGVHKLRITWNTGAADVLYADAFNVISPIHSPKSNLPGDIQNTLLVGSCAIGDSRKFSSTSVKTLTNWAQAVGVGSSQTTTITGSPGVPMLDMSCTIKTSGNPIQMLTVLTANVSVTPQRLSVFFVVDGVVVNNGTYNRSATNGLDMQLSFTSIVPVSAGVHKVDVYWSVGSGTGTISDTPRILTVQEL